MGRTYLWFEGERKLVEYTGPGMIIESFIGERIHVVVFGGSDTAPGGDPIYPVAPYDGCAY